MFEHLRLDNDERDTRGRQPLAGRRHRATALGIRHWISHRLQGADQAHPLWGSQAGNSLSGRRQFQAADHKVKQLVPSVKDPVAGECAQIIEEGTARRQGSPE